MDDSETRDKKAITQALNLNKKLSRVKKLIFKLFAKLYVLHDRNNYQSRQLFFELIIQVFLNSVLLTSLVLPTNLKLKNWFNYSSYWRMLSYSRFDVICFELDYSEKCLAASYTICLLVTSIWMFAFILIKYKYRATILLFFLRRLLKFIEFFSISLLILHFITIKYSWQGGIITEYRINYPSKNSNRELAFSIISILIIFISVVSNALFGYESRHYFALKSLEAKSTGRVSVISELCNYLTVVIYIFFAQENFILFRCSVIIIHAIVSILYYKRLPYYNYNINYIKSLPHLVLLASSLYSLISKLIDDATFSILGSIIITPLWLVFMIMIFNHQVAGVSKMNSKLCKLDWEFELCLRNQLINHSEDSEKKVIDKFGEHLAQANKDSSHVIVFWLTSYCFYACENPEIALIKLCSNKNLQMDYETEFHEYMLRKELKFLIFSQSSKYQLIARLNKAQKIKLLDQKVCILALRFFHSIQSKKNSLRTSKDVLNSLVRNLKKIMDKFKVATDRFRDSQSLYEAYSSFVELFFKNSELAAAIKLRVYGGMRRKSTDESTSEENLSIIVSAEEENFGSIIYIDSEIANCFGLDPNFYLGKPIISCFPESFNFFNTERLKEFKSHAYEETKYLESNAFIKFGHDFIKEVMVTVTLMGYSNVFFLFSFRSIKIKREAAIISSDNIILGCTKGFNQVLKLNCNACGFDINSVLEIDVSELKLTETNAIKIDSIQSLVVYIETEILNTKISYLYFYLDELVNEEKKDDVRLYQGIDKFLINSVTQIKFRNSLLLSSEAEIAETRLLESKVESSSTKSGSNSKFKSKLNREFMILMRSIKAFKIILMICVIFMQVAVAVCSYIIITVYLSSAINDQLNYKGIELLGSSIYSLVSIADMSSLIEIEVQNKRERIQKYQVNMQRSLMKLKETYGNYSSFDSNWDYCPQAYSLFENKLPVYIQSTKTFEIRYFTAYDFFAEVISTVSKT